MKSSRTIVLVAAVVVAGGVSATLGLRLLGSARAAVGPLPAEALALPAQASFVGGLDVQRLVASPLYTDFVAERSDEMPEALRRLKDRTGVDPLRDVDHIVVAGWQLESGKGTGALALLGRFDVSAVSASVEAEAEGVTWKKQHGTTIYLIDEETGADGNPGGPGALSFLGDRAIVMGDPEAVETTVANHAAGAGHGLDANPDMVARIGRLRPDAALWLTGDGDAVGRAPQALPGSGAGTVPPVKLPPLRSLSITGDLDPAIAIEVVGEATDAEAAKNLADMVRGIAAMASLQASQKPELAELASAVSVTTEELTVRVNARFPYELLQSLRKSAPDQEPAPEPPKDDAEPK